MTLWRTVQIRLLLFIMQAAAGRVTYRIVVYRADRRTDRQLAVPIGVWLASGVMSHRSAQQKMLHA